MSKIKSRTETPPVSFLNWFDSNKGKVTTISNGTRTVKGYGSNSSSSKKDGWNKWKKK